MKQNIELIYNHTFNGIIWKVFFDLTSNTLAIEVRDKSSMSLKIYVLSLENNRLENIDLPFLDWWMMLEGVENEKLIFKTYTEDNNPELIKTTWYDFINHKIISDDSGLYPDSMFENPSINIFFYPKDSEYFDLVKQFIWQIVQVKIASVGVEYFENERYIIVSYYMGLEKLNNFLLVVDVEKNIQFHEKLAQNLEAIGSNTFFCTHDKLIFVKKSNEINVYQFN